MNKFPYVSIIIPTFNRRDSLRVALEAFNDQTYPLTAFEVIVVDDGSTDGTCAMLDEGRGRYGFRLVLLKGERCGPGHARNSGIEVANGEILLFTDSDCVPHPQWVEFLSTCLAERQFQAGGRIEVAGDFPWVARIVNYVMNSWLGGFGSQWRFFGFLPGRRLRTMNAGVLRSAAMSVGGFRCSAGSYGEDTEFGEAIEQQGRPLAHCASAIVYHRENRRAPDFMLEAVAKGIAQVRLLRRGAIRFRGIHALPMALPLLLLATVASTFCSGRLATWLGMTWAVYAIVLQMCALKAAIIFRSVIPGIMLAPVTVGLHFSYGIGSLLGLATVSPPAKGPSSPTWLTRGSVSLGHSEPSISCTTVVP